MPSIRAMVVEDFYKNSEQRLVEQNNSRFLWKRTWNSTVNTMNWANPDTPELKVLYPPVTAVSISHALELTVDSVRIDCWLRWRPEVRQASDAREREKIN